LLQCVVTMRCQRTVISRCHPRAASQSALAFAVALAKSVAAWSTPPSRERGLRCGWTAVMVRPRMSRPLAWGRQRILLLASDWCGAVPSSGIPVGVGLALPWIRGRQETVPRFAGPALCTGGRCGQRFCDSPCRKCGACSRCLRRHPGTPVFQAGVGQINLAVGRLGAGPDIIRLRTLSMPLLIGKIVRPNRD